MGVRTAMEPTWHSTETDTQECSGRSGIRIRIRNVYLGTRIMIFLFILDPGSNNSTERGGEKICFVLPFCSHKYHKIGNIFLFNRKRNFLKPKHEELQQFLPKNLSLSFQKYGFGIRHPKKAIPDPGSKKHRIPDPDPQHWVGP